MSKSSRSDDQRCGLASLRAALARRPASRSAPARAVDLPTVGGSAGQARRHRDRRSSRSASRRARARSRDDQGYFAWLNRLNARPRLEEAHARRAPRLVVLRAASRGPDVRRRRSCSATRSIDGATRYRDAIYPAKLFLTYKNDGLEVTAGDAYVQFGRGLVLSMRKVDELGIDTTLFGGKVVVQKDPFAFTLIAGLANPARVDEPTGPRALPSAARPRATPRRPRSRSSATIASSARQIQAGRGLPVVASTHAVMPHASARRTATTPTARSSTTRSTRRSARARSRIARRGSTSSRTARPGPRVARDDQRRARASRSRASGDTATSTSKARSRSATRDARRRGEHAGQRALRRRSSRPGGPVTNTLEVKSYRNFFPLAGVGRTCRAPRRSRNIAYSAPPTAEPIISRHDVRLLQRVRHRRARPLRLSPHADAPRLRDVRLLRDAERESPAASAIASARAPRRTRTATTNYVTDVERRRRVALRRRQVDRVRQRHRARRRQASNGDAYYREVAGQYSITKYISGPYSIELAGRHRYRIQDGENIRGGSVRRGSRGGRASTRTR